VFALTPNDCKFLKSLRISTAGFEMASELVPVLQAHTTNLRSVLWQKSVDAWASDRHSKAPCRCGQHDAPIFYCYRPGQIS
jgi:hypothetical protein